MKNNRGINKAVIIISKIIEVGSWIACGFLTTMTIMVLTGHMEMLKYASDISAETAELTNGGFTLRVLDAAGNGIPGAYVVFFITMILVCALQAMAARNINLIFKTAEGKTRFSQGQTPFQPDNIRMVREIGYFLIAAPIVELVMSVIARIVLSAEMVEASVNMGQVFVGLIVLALSQFFAYGMELQNDVDGLV